MKLLLSSGSVYMLSLQELFPAARTAGFDGLEYVVDRRHKPQHRHELSELADASGLPVLNVHAPYLLLDGWGDEIESIKRSVDLSAEVGAGSITFHPPHRTVEDVDFARWISETDDFQRDVGGGQVHVTMENMPKVKVWRGLRVPFATSQFRYQKRDEFWEVLERHNLGMTLDTTHVGTTGDNLGAYHAQFRDRIAVVHLSNFRSSDFQEHMPLTEGDLDLAAFLRRLVATNFDGKLTLEVRPRFVAEHPGGIPGALRESVEWMRTHLIAG
jgi:sugar phosphate isomerase/epimerase